MASQSLGKNASMSLSGESLNAPSLLPSDDASQTSPERCRTISPSTDGTITSCYRSPAAKEIAQPPRKRQACKFCNASKVKCAKCSSGGEVCERCQKRGFDCTYELVSRIGKPKGAKNKSTLRRLQMEAEQRAATMATAKEAADSSKPPSARGISGDALNYSNTPEVSSGAVDTEPPPIQDLSFDYYTAGMDPGHISRASSMIERGQNPLVMNEMSSVLPSGQFVSSHNNVWEGNANYSLDTNNNFFPSLSPHMASLSGQVSDFRAFEASDSFGPVRCSGTQQIAPVQSFGSESQTSAFSWDNSPLLEPSQPGVIWHQMTPHSG